MLGISRGTAERLNKDSIDNFVINDFINNKSGNGYQELPNGLILQWGTVYLNTSSKTFNFPISFPNGVFIVLSTLNTSQNNWVSGTYSYTLTGFTLSGPYSYNYKFFAIGY